MFLGNFSEYSNWFREPNFDYLWGTPYALTDCIEISSFITLLRKYYFWEQGRDAAVVSALSLTNLARVRFRPSATCGLSVLLVLALL